MKKLLFFLMVIFAAGLDVFLYIAGIVPIKPIYTFLPVFFILFFLTYNSVTVISLIKTRARTFLLLIFILSTVYAFNSPANEEVVLTEIVNSAISLLLYISFYIVFTTSKPLEVKIFFITSIVIIIIGLLYDMFFGLNPTNLNVRKGGFFGNPNVAATSLKFLGLCLLFLMRKNVKLRSGLLILIILSIFMTFSRSGLIGILFIAILMIFNEWKPKFNFSGIKFITSGIKIIIASFLIYFALFVSAEYLQQKIPALNQGDAKDRIDLLLGKSGKGGITTNDDNSSFGRKNLTIMYTHEFRDRPFGHGTAYSSDFDIKLQDTHNVFLKMAINYGVIGFILIVGFFISSLSKAINRDNYFYFVFILILITEGLASHNMFFERPLLISLAMMDSILYADKNSKILNITQHDTKQQHTGSI